MLPKLWDGPNPVGEAKARQLATIDAPFLSASGPGYNTRKAGDFSEVTGTTTKTETVVDGWLSISSPFYDNMVYTVGAIDPRFGFKKRSTVAGSSSGWASSVPIVVADEAGHGFAAVTQTITDSDLAPMDVVKFSRVGGTPKVVTSFSVYKWSMILEAGRTSPTFTSFWVVIDNMLAMVKATHWLREVDGVWRNTPESSALFFARDGSVFSATIGVPELPVGHDIPSDTWCALTPMRFLRMIPTHPVEPPKMYISDDFGTTWGAGIDIAGVCPGWAAAIAYKTEAEILAENGALAGTQVRTRYIKQTQIVAFLIGHNNANLLAINANTVLIKTGPYTSGLKTGDATPYTTALSVVTTAGAIRISRQRDILVEQANQLVHMAVVMLGRDAWIAHEYTFVGGSSSITETFEVNVTFDCGMTYTNVTGSMPPGARVNRWTVEQRYEGPEPDGSKKFSVLCQCDEAGSLRLYETKDFETFKRRGLLAKAEYVDHPSDFTHLTKIGTRRDPGQVNMAIPWSNSDVLNPPDWWINE